MASLTGTVIYGLWDEKRSIIADEEAAGKRYAASSHAPRDMGSDRLQIIRRPELKFLSYTLFARLTRV